MTEWQPIDTAPKNGVEILVAWFDDCCWRVKVAYWGADYDCEGWVDDIWVESSASDTFPATHWLPIPPEPEEVMQKILNP